MIDWAMAAADTHRNCRSDGLVYIILGAFYGGFKWITERQKAGNRGCADRAGDRGAGGQRRGLSIGAAGCGPVGA